MDAVLTFFSAPAGIGLAALIITTLIALVMLVVRRSGTAGPFIPEPPSTPAPESTQARALKTDSSQPPEARAGPVDRSIPTLSAQSEEAKEAAETDALIEIPESLPPRMQRLRSRLSGSDSLGRAIVQVLSRGELRATDWEEIEDTLLITDPSLDATDGLMSRMEERIAIARASDSNTIRTSLAEKLLALVDENLNRSLHLDKRDGNGELPATILTIGVNGTGKTTTVDKLARVLIAEGKSVLLSTADTFRAAAAEQLSTWDERVGVDVIKSNREGAGPTAIAFDAIKQEAMRAVDVVLVDTVGRLQTRSTLMEELGKVKRVMEKQAPVGEVLLVLDATTGQNDLKQAQVFVEVAGIAGIVLTRLDDSAKGGIVVSVQKTLGVPIKFVGLGEGANDLVPFNPRSFVDTIVSSRGLLDPTHPRPKSEAGASCDRLARVIEGHPRHAHTGETSVFGNPSDRLMQSFKQLRSRGILTESGVDQTIFEIRCALINADVALPIVRQFTSEAQEKAYDAARSEALNPGQQVIRTVHEELIKILGGQTRELSFTDRGPVVFMLAGLQGAGKTTLAGKLGKWLRGEDKRVFLVASDLQRPNAVQQLQIVDERAGVEAWTPEPGSGVGDPVHVAHTGLNHAIETGIDIVIIDAAGRLGVGEEMMAQTITIRDAVEPREIVFALNAMIGQGAIQTSTALHNGVGFIGVVLSKFDGDARGSVAFPVRGVTDAPILFASTGEDLGDLERFRANRVTGRILDIGDVLTLIEQAGKRPGAEEAERITAKALPGELTLAGFLSQLQQIKKLDSMKKMLGMIPGVAQMREQIENFDECEVDHVETIIRSMTLQECEDMPILNDSRRARIARNSGTDIADVNGLVKRFEMTKETMSQMGQAGGAVPGFGSMPGREGKAKQKTNTRKAKADRVEVKKKARPGSPTKCRRQELEALPPRG